jgi:phospholipid/cholesterol/gamma-HCH transport system substrate-binding protein
MITRNEKFRLGIFLLASVLMLAGTVAVLVGSRLMEARDRYKIRFDESVSGLDVGAQVKLSGVRVGQVEDIRIDPGNANTVVVIVSLREKTPIRSDSKAVMRTLGITGLRFIEIRGGTGRGELLKPGGEIRAGHSVLGTLEGKAHDIAVKTEMAVNRVLEAMSEENLRNLEVILANARDISGEVNTLLEDNHDEIDGIVADFSEASKDLKEMVASANRSSARLESILQTQQPKIDVIMDNVNETTLTFKNTAKKLEKVDSVLTKIDRTLGELNEQIEAANVGEIADGAEKALTETSEILKSMRRVMQASRMDVYRSVKSMKRSMDNMEQFSAEIRDNPSLILSADSPPEREIE